MSVKGDIRMKELEPSHNENKFRTLCGIPLEASVSAPPDRIVAHPDIINQIATAAMSDVTYTHVQWGFCTVHGFGVCPPDCPSISVPR